MKNMQDKILALEIKLRNAMSSEILENASKEQKEQAWCEYRKSVKELVTSTYIIKEAIIDYLEKEVQNRSVSLFEDINSGETLYNFNIEKVEKQIEELRAIKQTIKCISSTKFKVKWAHKEPILSEKQKQLINEELSLINDDLDLASDLIFHTILLSKNTEGPVVMVDGREGIDDTLFLTYYEKPEWTTISDEKSIHYNS